MPSASQDTYQQIFGMWGLLRLSRTAGVCGFFPATHCITMRHTEHTNKLRHYLGRISSLA
jgi:hypothetical protein